MDKMCFFCKREPAESQCEICKRWVCFQCKECHNCYPREGRAAAAVLLLFLTACATTRPERVPEFDISALPRLELKSLKPRALHISVENTRTINKKVGNTTTVEKAVYEAITSTLKTSGVTLSAKSKNAIHVVVQDCPDTEEGAECVKMTAKIDLPRMSYELSAWTTHGYTKGNGAGMAFGDVTEAYQGALTHLLKNIDEKFND
jgi:hypothetical protein